MEEFKEVVLSNLRQYWFTTYFKQHRKSDISGRIEKQMLEKLVNTQELAAYDIQKYSLFEIEQKEAQVLDKTCDTAAEFEEEKVEPFGPFSLAKPKQPQQRKDEFSNSEEQFEAKNKLYQLQQSTIMQNNFSENSDFEISDGLSNFSQYLEEPEQIVSNASPSINEFFNMNRNTQVQPNLQYNCPPMRSKLHFNNNY